ncbi:hypothetical protein CXB51_021250 [Gossypium anomalum]|uniref:DUF4218 domain-containing protein n=1 Tax=Gossypium anomalum TaxID=47600 RepID=A0A8J5YS38_9ROSI|nr:hypothetical protein CXB51_021250 [Gossypium anomalum]
MHIEKNVCENIIGAILNADGKLKDNFQSRLDLVDMRIQRDLHPQVVPNGKYRLPPSIFSMSKEEKEVFCMVLKDIKVLDAYASNICRCVSLKDRRLYSLKSHDYHILMQDLLPVALRCCMSKNVMSYIIELSNIMKAICGKVLDVEELEKVQDRAALTLCNLEKIFPPSFFIIMVHLVIHLPHEAILGGPIFYRWMYPIESEYKQILRSRSRSRRLQNREINKLFTESFHEWLSQTVWSGKDINDEVKWLSQGPNRVIKRYSAFLINGYRFHTKYRERIRRTQNCGIVVNSSITSYASARDSNLVEGNVEYYGLLTDIIELDYYGKWKVVLFRCDWADTTIDGYVFSSQVKQVFYSKDPTDECWYVVRRNTPRDLFDMGNGSRDDIVERSKTLPFPEQNLDENIPSTRKMHRRRLRDLSIVQNTPNSEEPVGSEARLLAGYLGIIAGNANMLPINYESWHHMPDSNKNQALDNIKERFALEVSDDYIKKALGKKWRDHKSTLKKQYFKKDISLEEKLRNVPPGMLRYQWEDAVRFWNSKKGEDRERVGISSRQKQKFTHTTGSRSFASEVSSGQKVRRLQLFEITHRKKDGSPMTSEAREIMEKLKEKKAEYEVIALTDSSVNPENIDNIIITEVLGPESQAQAKVQRLRDQIAQMQASTVDQIAEVQRKYEELQQQLRADAATREATVAAKEAEAAVMAAEQSKKYYELQLQLQHIMKMFQQSQKPSS